MERMNIKQDNLLNEESLETSKRENSIKFYKKLSLILFQVTKYKKKYQNELHRLQGNFENFKLLSESTCSNIIFR